MRVCIAHFRFFFTQYRYVHSWHFAEDLFVNIDALLWEEVDECVWKNREGERKFIKFIFCLIPFIYSCEALCQCSSNPFNWIASEIRHHQFFKHLFHQNLILSNSNFGSTKRNVERIIMRSLNFSRRQTSIIMCSANIKWFAARCPSANYCIRRNMSIGRWNPRHITIT